MKATNRVVLNQFLATATLNEVVISCAVLLCALAPVSSAGVEGPTFVVFDVPGATSNRWSLSSVVSKIARRSSSLSG